MRIVIVCNGNLLFAFSFCLNIFLFLLPTNRLFFRENSTHFQPKKPKMQIAVVNECVLLFLPTFVCCYCFSFFFSLGIEANENSTFREWFINIIVVVRTHTYSETRWFRTTDCIRCPHRQRGRNVTIGYAAP